MYVINANVIVSIHFKCTPYIYYPLHGNVLVPHINPENSLRDVMNERLLIHVLNCAKQKNLYTSYPFIIYFVTYTNKISVKVLVL